MREDKSINSKNITVPSRVDYVANTINGPEEETG